MMICKADFEELFPEIFPSEPCNAPKAKVACLARWEDGKTPGFVDALSGDLECQEGAMPEASFTGEYKRDSAVQVAERGFALC